MQTLALVRVLKSLDFTIVVICYFEYEAVIVNEFQKKGAKVILLKMKRGENSLAIIKRLTQITRINKPDVVHVQYMAPGALPIIAGRLAGVKTVFVTVHQPWTPSHGKFSKLILHMASLLCTQFIAVSVNAEKSWFGSGKLFDENKPTILQPRHFTIHNSVDAERIQQIVNSVKVELMKESLYIPIGSIVIGAVSRLSHEKGIDVLIKSFNQLVKEGSQVHLLIVGSGPDEKKLKETAQVFGIDPNITFYGEADWETAMKLIALMDVVMVPSRFEGFGLTAAEAMAAGKPVIATDNFGLKEVVADHETGLLFKTGDISDLKEKLKTLLESPVLRKKYGISGKEKAMALFDISIFQKKIAALYKNYDH
jgi:L-malate glycosyltransferase